MYAHIATTNHTATNYYAGKVKKANLVFNTPMTGTVTVSDETGTTGSPVVAIITNPLVGQTYEYWTLLNGVTITPSTTGADITLNLDLSFSGTAY